MRTVTAFVAAVVVVLSGLAVGPPASGLSADVVRQRDVIPLLPIGPKVVLPGQKVTFLVPFNNTEDYPESATVKFGAGCASRDDGQGYVEKYNPWEDITILPANPRDPEPDVFWPARIQIPKVCYHQTLSNGADLPGGDGTYVVRVADYLGTGSEGRMSLPFEIGKNFTRRNIRYNLALQDGGRSSKRYQAHHTMPVKFEAWFERRRININDPQYLVWWCSKKGVPTNHQTNARSYNVRWEEWIRANRKATKEQVLVFRADLFDDYVYECP